MIEKPILRIEIDWKKKTGRVTSLTGGHVAEFEEDPKKDITNIKLSEEGPRPLKHPLCFISEKGKLAEALGLTPEQCSPIEQIVEDAIKNKHNLRQLLETVGQLEISDEVWANFLYTYGYWDGQRS